MKAPAVVFMGSKDAGLALCELLCTMLPPGALRAILCPDDRNDARSVLTKFEALAARANIPLRVVKNNAETLAGIALHEPRHVIVHGWYQIIPVNSVRETEFFGFHYSPLPMYRGNAPLVWQILRGEPEIGITLFRFSEGMDEGDIAGQSRFTLGMDETIADALVRANEHMLETARKVLPSLFDGTLMLQSQADAGASYCGLRTPEDGHIDWTWGARRVHDFVRAQTRPYPGAFSLLPDGRQIRIWRTVVEPRLFYGVPGGIADANDDWAVVTCGEGAVRILEIGLDNVTSTSPMPLLKSQKIRLR